MLDLLTAIKTPSRLWPLGVGFLMFFTDRRTRGCRQTWLCSSPEPLQVRHIPETSWGAEELLSCPLYSCSDWELDSAHYLPTKEVLSDRSPLFTLNLSQCLCSCIQLTLLSKWLTYEDMLTANVKANNKLRRRKPPVRLCQRWQGQSAGIEGSTGWEMLSDQLGFQFLEDRYLFW